MEHNKGIALYVLIVITGIGLAIALGVSDIVFIESRVSRGLLPSYAAFFAADAGAECAEYWHIDQDVFDPLSPPANVTCNGGSVPVTHPPPSAGVEVFDFSFNYPDPIGSPYCVSVRVAKATVDGDPCSAIRSSGQNLVCGGSLTDNSLERTLIVQIPEDCEFNF